MVASPSHVIPAQGQDALFAPSMVASRSVTVAPSAMDTLYAPSSAPRIVMPFVATASPLSLERLPFQRNVSVEPLTVSLRPSSAATEPAMPAAPLPRAVSEPLPVMASVLPDGTWTPEPPS